jgi:transposase
MEQLITMLRAGNHVDIAAAAAGVPASTIAMLRERGGEIAEKVAQAAAEGEVRAVTQIAQAAAHNWQAAAWLLERTYPDRWARPVSRENEQPAPTMPVKDGVDDLAARRRERRKPA